MSVEEPADTAPIGSPAFILTLLCACLTYEARFLARAAHGFSHAEPLPNWLRTPPRHPLTRLVNNAARVRYAQGARQLDPQTKGMKGITVPVAQVIQDWASGQIDLVTDDISEGPPDTLFTDF